MIATTQNINQLKSNPAETSSNLQIQRKPVCGSDSKLSSLRQICEKHKSFGIQKKLKVGSRNDRYEQEDENQSIKTEEVFMQDIAEPN